MKLRLNGAERDVRAGLTVQELLTELGLDRPGVAVAVDGRVVPRSEHGDRALTEGSVVEVIRAVGGG